MTPKKRLLRKLVDTALRGGPRAAPARRGARGAAAPRELILPRFRRSVSASAALPPEENIGNSLVEGLRLTKNMASSNLPRVALPDPAGARVRRSPLRHARRFSHALLQKSLRTWRLSAL
jgi:hypothetical protein